MKRFEEIKKWLTEEENEQGTVEYGLIIVLIAAIVITALATIGTSLKDKFEEIMAAVSK